MFPCMICTGQIPTNMPHWSYFTVMKQVRDVAQESLECRIGECKSLRNLKLRFLSHPPSLDLMEVFRAPNLRSLQVRPHVGLKIPKESANFEIVSKSADIWIETIDETGFTSQEESMLRDSGLQIEQYSYSSSGNVAWEKPDKNHHCKDVQELMKRPESILFTPEKSNADPTTQKQARYWKYIRASPLSCEVGFVSAGQEVKPGMPSFRIVLSLKMSRSKFNLKVSWTQSRLPVYVMMLFLIAIRPDLRLLKMTGACLKSYIFPLKAQKNK